MVYASGHEHNLQVIETASPTLPRYQLVSGSGSKVKYVGAVEGTAYAAERPGYMQIAVMADGTVGLRVIAGELEECPTGPESARCLDEEARRFVTVYSARLD